MSYYLTRVLYNRDEFVFLPSIRLSAHTPAPIGEKWRDSFDGESALRLRGRQFSEFAVPRGGRLVDSFRSDNHTTVAPREEKESSTYQRVIPKPNQVPQS
jgi:hypothetical protein